VRLLQYPAVSRLFSAVPHIQGFGRQLRLGLSRSAVLPYPPTSVALRIMKVSDLFAASDASIACLIAAFPMTIGAFGGSCTHWSSQSWINPLSWNSHPPEPSIAIRIICLVIPHRLLGGRESSLARSASVLMVSLLPLSSLPGTSWNWLRKFSPSSAVLIRWLGWIG
jgi:hypothetical protein